MKQPLTQSAVVTGAGSGVGRAVALELARQGWQVALVGRRAAALEETAQLSGAARMRMLACPCDISHAQEVEAMGNRVMSAFEKVEVLVNAAGTNTPQRCLAELSFENYQRIVETNLTGAFLCTQEFLPGMRLRHSGTIVNIVSDAGKIANAKAGPAYVASKFAMAGLTQAINAEERAHGIRACAIFPGDINTPILELRRSPPPPEARDKMLQPEDIAACVMLAVNLPPRAIVEELVVRPR
jgi:NAD(P)-dependent dehydrogenase (short-subunit alcohol dehydrogenase family)